MAALLGLAFAFSLALSSCIVSASPLVGVGSEGSVLQALLESHFSEWMELVERAQMLHPLEQLVGGLNGRKLTIFAPMNHQLQPNIKSYILKPSNAHLLKKTVEFHVLSERITASEWHNATVSSLAEDSPVTLSYSQRPGSNVKLFVGEADVVAADCIVRADGVVHGVDQLLLPISVQQEYVAFSTKTLATPLPSGAPVLDNRRAALLERSVGSQEVLTAKLINHHIAFSPSISPVTAPSPVFAPAPGPSLGPSGAPLYVGKGEAEVTNFITALHNLGGYDEFASILVDLTSLGSEISKLVNTGVKLTILAPDDKAWKVELTHDQLVSPAAIEEILHYHILTEYQTEESLYSTLRRNGKFAFPTLREPYKLIGEEVDGIVSFGEGDDKAKIFDPDINADGWISVQGIDRVLKPNETSKATALVASETKSRSLLEMLELPSRIWRNTSGGSGRMGSPLLPAVAAFIVLLATTLLV